MKRTKRIKLINISILSSTLLFIGCSQNSPQAPEIAAKSNASIYNIMGISEPMVSERLTPINPIAVSPDITYVSYKKTPYFKSFTQQNTQTIQQIEKGAKSFLGIPYVWGATGPNKFDCSGFTQWVYRDAGINIPRVSKNQARVGQFVKYENLAPGDMVFFDTKKKRTGLVNHVGIYLGNNNFIHASSRGKGVVIYNFEQEQFYKKRFLWGRRVIKPKLHYTLK